MVLVALASWYSGSSGPPEPVKKPPTLVRFVPSHIPTPEPEPEPVDPLEAIDAPRLPMETEQARLTPIVRTQPDNPGPKDWQSTVESAPVTARTPRPPSRLTPALPPVGPPSTVQALRTIPELLSNVAPEYPERCRRRGHEGAALFELDIDVTGKVSDARLLDESPCHRLDASAKRTALGLRFRPATENGVPVATTIEFSIRFQLKAGK